MPLFPINCSDAADRCESESQLFFKLVFSIRPVDDRKIVIAMSTFMNAKTNVGISISDASWEPHLIAIMYGSPSPSRIA